MRGPTVYRGPWTRPRTVVYVYLCLFVYTYMWLIEWGWFNYFIRNSLVVLLGSICSDRTWYIHVFTYISTPGITVITKYIPMFTQLHWARTTSLSMYICMYIYMYIYIYTYILCTPIQSTCILRFSRSGFFWPSRCPSHNWAHIKYPSSLCVCTRVYKHTHTHHPNTRKNREIYKTKPSSLPLPKHSLSRQ